MKDLREALAIVRDALAILVMVVLLILLITYAPDLRNYVDHVTLGGSVR